MDALGLLRRYCFHMVGLAAALLVAGCHPYLIAMATYHERPVGSNSRLWGGYAAGETYTLKLDGFLTDIGWPISGPEPGKLPPHRREWGIVPPRRWARYNLAPPSVPAYLGNPSAYEYVEAVIPAGTRVRVHELRKRSALFAHSEVHVWAEVLDGSYNGYIVDISDLSKPVSDEKGGIFEYEPNPALLEKVNDGK